MSVAQLWTQSKIQHLDARAEVLRKLDEAAAQGVDATLIVGPGLTSDGRSYVGRWDGRELVVFELTHKQQRDWRIGPGEMSIRLEATSLLLSCSPGSELVSLRVTGVDGAAAHDGRSPLTGTCQAELAGPIYRPIENCSIRARYFRPGEPSQVTAMWYPNHALFAPKTELQFSFSPVFSDEDSRYTKGLMVVYLQMFAADSWSPEANGRRISNLTHTTVILK